MLERLRLRVVPLLGGFRTAAPPMPSASVPFCTAALLAFAGGLFRATTLRSAEVGGRGRLALAPFGTATLLACAGGLFRATTLRSVEVGGGGRLALAPFGTATLLTCAGGLFRATTLSSAEVGGGGRLALAPFGSTAGQTATGDLPFVARLALGARTLVGTAAVERAATVITGSRLVARATRFTVACRVLEMPPSLTPFGRLATVARA